MLGCDASSKPVKEAALAVKIANIDVLSIETLFQDFFARNLNLFFGGKLQVLFSTNLVNKVGF